MVDRFTDKETQKALTVVDLDGTYVTCNTLREYILIGLRHHLRRWHLRSSLTVCTMMALRIMRLISHKTMKFTCLDALAKDRGFHDRFAARMRASVNGDVASVIATNHNKGRLILLATAAPDFYVPLIWDGDYVATASVDNPQRTECRGQEKLRRVLDFARLHNCHIDTVITDHHDDAPLLKYNSSGTNILVKPSKKTLRFLREFEPAHLFIVKEGGKLGVAR